MYVLFVWLIPHYYSFVLLSVWPCTHLFSVFSFLMISFVPRDFKYHLYAENPQFLIYIFFYFFNIYLFIFRQRGREEERKGEKHQCLVVSHMPHVWGPGLQPRHVPQLGIKPFGSQASPQSTESHQPGSQFYILQGAHIYMSKTKMFTQPKLVITVEFTSSP